MKKLWKSKKEDLEESKVEEVVDQDTSTPAQSSISIEDVIDSTEECSYRPHCFGHNTYGYVTCPEEVDYYHSPSFRRYQVTKSVPFSTRYDDSLDEGSEERFERELVHQILSREPRKRMKNKEDFILYENSKSRTDPRLHKESLVEQYEKKLQIVSENSLRENENYYTVIESIVNKLDSLTIPSFFNNDVHLSVSIPVTGTSDRLAAFGIKVPCEFIHNVSRAQVNISKIIQEEFPKVFSKETLDNESEGLIVEMVVSEIFDQLNSDFKKKLCEEVDRVYCYVSGR